MKRIKKYFAIALASAALIALPVNTYAKVSPSRTPNTNVPVTKTSPKTSDDTVVIFGAGAAACVAVAAVAGRKRQKNA